MGTGGGWGGGQGLGRETPPVRTQGSVEVPQSRLWGQTRVPRFFVPSMTLATGRGRLRAPRHGGRVF